MHLTHYRPCNWIQVHSPGCSLNVQKYREVIFNHMYFYVTGNYVTCFSKMATTNQTGLCEI